ncbi:MAG: hypothetical protein IPP51_08705 [Bacteroidetes bacterium]|nr:hypothetical protein [Bacteroidota bacterium]
MKFLSKKISLIYLVILVIISATAISYFFLNPVKVIEKTAENNTAQIELIRSSNRKLIRPLMMVEVPNEDPSLGGLNQAYKTISIVKKFQAN